MLENRYSIVLAHKAKTELEDILDYIIYNFHAEETAEKTLDTIEKGIEQLKSMPLSAPLMGEEEYRKIGIRKLTIKKYNVFYVINEQECTVKIIHILHSLQDYKRALND